MAQSGRRLTARPAESELPGTEFNYFQKQQSFAKTAFIYYTFKLKFKSSRNFA
ncbi:MULTISPECIES: hypothetical protein [Fictibacillus]|uniref:hypothetical protein n=1 Tax=Fictibacillus TaxID=1329200 RepID=UPI0013EE6C57|nr:MULTISPECIES: hypothetical protein [Fictibacillus]